MKQIIVMAVLAASLFAKLVPYVGIGMNATELEDVETRSNSPLGIFGIRETGEHFELFVQHISSIPDTGIETRGLNIFGGTVNYDIGPVELFAGRAWHSESFDGEYYSDQFDTQMERCGMRVHFRGDRSLFIERILSIDREKADLVLYGFEMQFELEK